MKHHHYILINNLLEAEDETSTIIGWWITDNEPMAIEEAKKRMKSKNLNPQSVSFIKGESINL